jgi:Trm5-related predicted tRNA methylase
MEFDPTKTYVIGGIVDRTVRKGVTSTYAVRRYAITAYLFMWLQTAID